MFASKPPFRHARAVHVAVAMLVAIIVAGCHRPLRTASTRPIDPLGPLGALPAPLYGARLPESIADSTFWRMVRTFSEPGGYFQSENFVSNEMGLQHVVSRIRLGTPSGGAYLGVGPEQNFTYIAALHPRVAFVVDIRRQNLLQHLWYKAVFELSPTRIEFLSRLFARPLPRSVAAASSADSLISALERTPADFAYFQRTFNEVRDRLIKHHGFTLDSADQWTLRYVDSVFYASGPQLNYSSGSVNGTRGGGFSGRGGNFMPTFAQVAGATDESGHNIGFLGSEASYAVVRDLQRRNLVIPIVGNFAGPAALRNVGDWLRERDAKVNVFYTSNVEQYLFRQGDEWSRFYNNVGTLPLDSTSTFIRSVTGRGFGGTPQNSTSGFMMTQLTSSVTEIVRDVRSGAVRAYYDVIGRSH